MSNCKLLVLAAASCCAGAAFAQTVRPAWTSTRDDIDVPKVVVVQPAPGGIAGVPANDTCGTATAVGDGSFPWSTIGAAIDQAPNPNCAGGGFWGPDVFFCYTATCTGIAHADTFNSGGFDTVIAAWDGCTCPSAGAPLACNDDASATTLESAIAFNVTSGHTYLIGVAGWNGPPSTGEGEGMLNISCSTGPCVSCPQGGIPENDPTCAPGLDVTNGGCNSVPPVFTTVHCGDTICGTGSRQPEPPPSTLVRRDTDWYKLILTADTEVTQTVTAATEFTNGIVIGQIENIGRGLCSDDTGFINPFGVGVPCQAVSVTVCLPPGEWWFFVGAYPSGTVVCGAQYTCSFTCQPCTVPTGACCLPNGSCASLTMAGTSGCLASGGAYAGDGVDCSSVQCPVNDSCANAIAVDIGSTVAGSTALATYDAAPDCNGVPNDAGTGGLWYKVTGDGTTLSATLCSVNTSYDTKLSVYCGGCGNLTCVNANDDDPNCGIDALQSTVNFCSSAGQEYLILVHGFGGASGNFELFVSSDSTACSGAVECPTACPNSVRGDSNCDGVVDNSDIDCFVAALLGTPCDNGPDCAYDVICLNDANYDGVVDNSDIDCFVSGLLGSPCSPP